MQQLNSDEIIKLILSSKEIDNDKAFRVIYRNDYEVIRKFILSNNGSDKDAEDIFQDALIVFFHQVKNQNLELNCTIQTYLYSICRNLWLKKLRKNNRVVMLTEEVKQFVSIDETHFDTLIENEESNIVRQMLRHLGKDCRQILLYFYFEKNKMKEIAEKMNLANEQVAKNKKSLCLKKLKAIVKESTFYKNNLKNLFKK